jgi:hypothetical protein
MATDPETDKRCPNCDAPSQLRTRLRAVADRLKQAATDVGGDVMVKLPNRLGDHEGLLLALANELEDLIK